MKTKQGAKRPEKPAKASKAISKSDAEIARDVADDPDTFIPDAAWFAGAKIVHRSRAKK